MAVWSREPNACFQSSERMCRGVVVMRDHSVACLSRSESSFYFGCKLTLQYGGINLIDGVQKRDRAIVNRICIVPFTFINRHHAWLYSSSSNVASWSSRSIQSSFSMPSGAAALRFLSCAIDVCNSSNVNIASFSSFGCNGALFFLLAAVWPGMAGAAHCLW